MKDKLFQLFFSVYLFWYSACASIFYFTGIEFDGIVLRIILISIFSISVYFYLSYDRTQVEYYLLFGLFLFGASYYLTHTFYVNIRPRLYSEHIGHLLRWGADSVSACLIGMTLMKQKQFDVVYKYIPLLCIIITPILVSMVIANSVKLSQYSLTNGLNYQLLAYYLALLFGYTSFFTFLGDYSSSKCIKILLLILLPIQAVTCLMSGGRGGVVLLSAYIIFVVILMWQQEKLSKIQLISIIFTAIIIFIVVANIFDLSNASGFARSSKLLHDDDRLNMWIKLWKYVEANNYVGYGLGSDFLVTRGYTHNFFLDFMIETGIMGTIILCIIFFKMYRSVFRNVFTNDIFIIICIVGIYGLVMNSFSGYWISTYSHWMILGVACTYKYHLEYQE